jgi:hypothetical protein
VSSQIPFAQVVRGSAWRSAAEGWVADAVGGLGARITGVSQPRVRPWSTQLVVDTTRGRFWFKANCAASAFEPQLQSVLAGLVPDAVDRPVAVDPERGWMLTADRGTTLQGSREPTLDDWVAVVRAEAALQREVETHREAVLVTGVPDCGPGTVLARFDDMLGRLTAVPPDHPSRLDDDHAARLEQARHLVVEAAAVLADGPVPATLQHGDLHPGNVFAVEGSLRIFDFGDAQWACALEALCTPRAVLRGGTIPWDAVQRAYLEAYDIDVASGDLDRLLDAAAITEAVNRSLTWWGAIAQADAAELADWGEGPARHLIRVLDHG